MTAVRYKYEVRFSLGERILHKAHLESESDTCSHHSQQDTRPTLTVITKNGRTFGRMKTEIEIGSSKGALS